jgi:hypothetical protein
MKRFSHSVNSLFLGINVSDDPQLLDFVNQICWEANYSNPDWGWQEAFLRNARALGCDDAGSKTTNSR